MLREIVELSTGELFERWQRFYLDREGDPSAALAVNVQLVERLTTERADAILAMVDDGNGATGKIGRMMKLTPMQTKSLLDRIARDCAQPAHVNGNGGNHVNDS
jgi:hypothetical protein